MNEIEKDEIRDALLKGLMACEAHMKNKHTSKAKLDIYKNRCKEIEQALKIMRTI
tara:strand:+ start:1547 stop:1711 length:165 start_codon:yes stop_codon:yes gene_type:complete